MTSHLTRAGFLRRVAQTGAAAAVVPSWLAETALGGRASVAVPANGNKRPTVFASDFTSRVATFPRTAYLLEPSATSASAVAMVIDELLVGEQAARDPVVTARLAVLGAFDTGATVFAGLVAAPREDVHIWRLRHTPGALQVPDVAAVVWSVRRILGARHIPEAQVAPNHVLIPANWHTCPWSPPEPPAGPGTLPPPTIAGPSVEVVVIDSGYIAEGPIASRVESPVYHGEWFTKLAGPGQPAYGWRPQVPESLDAGGDRRLDTLAAHAGFVAGVIAQACPRARITVVDHNGAFVERNVADTPIPTEASVARSLWRHRSADVINVGFAFATLPSRQIVSNTVNPSGPPSWAFGLVLRAMSRTTVLVAPAGNQASRTRQYPAAFAVGHPNVVGVGSIAPTGRRSLFSNHGSWVACCTEGENVLSTFVTSWNGPTEDAEPAGFPDAGAHPEKDFTSGWASWSGTSFAAPKVAGAIAGLVGPNRPALTAWNKLRQSSPAPAGSLGMGVTLSGLPPS